MFNWDDSKWSGNIREISTTFMKKTKANSVVFEVESRCPDRDCVCHDRDQITDFRQNWSRMNVPTGTCSEVKFNSSNGYILVCPDRDNLCPTRDKWKTANLLHISLKWCWLLMGTRLWFITTIIWLFKYKYDLQRSL